MTTESSEKTVAEDGYGDVGEKKDGSQSQDAIGQDVVMIRERRSMTQLPGGAGDAEPKPGRA